MPSYNPKVIEPRWQRYWRDNRTFRAPDSSEKPKYYILDMFPYPSGAGLHVGHPEGYTATDILARYRRMRGFNVLHPMGWDAFGLPAEQYAIQTGTHPATTTRQNIDTFRRQIQMLGFSYDWNREIDTTDPGYVKWTQWIFLVLYDTWYDDERRRGRPIAELPISKEIRAAGEAAVREYQDSKRLAYQAEVPVNWCPALGTVLANEEVVGGRSERGDHPVVRMPLRQWLLRITAYAERLLDDLALVDWSPAIKKMQQEWIGRSEGAEVDFALASDPAKKIRIFTTRPDTLFGATYVVWREHPLVDAVTAPEQQAAVAEYKAQAARKSDLERTELAKTKAGVFSGSYAINPVNNERIPIWIADYVLATYGTGAIMAVPAHDERDFEFATSFHLPIRAVVKPPREWLRAGPVFRVLRDMERGLDVSFQVGPDASTPAATESPTLHLIITTVMRHASEVWEALDGDLDRIAETLYAAHPELFEQAYVDEGFAIHSGEFDGLPTPRFKERITGWLAQRGTGTARVNYKLRDWLFSRQRYWGEPFPILHEIDADGRPTGVSRAVPVDELPVNLPAMEDFKPSGRPEPPLEKAADWLWVTRDGRRYKRETNTMPQWAGSCWYYLRYLDPKNDKSFCDPALERDWMPVDLYVGGAEHAVLHLLYARFWHKVLFDRGHVHTPEPFMKLVNQGMILGEIEWTAFRRGGKWISASEVDINSERERATGEQCERVSLDEDQVERKDDYSVLKEYPTIRVEGRAHKMSKARGNVINPDQVIEQYGADSMRLYEMFMGPLEATKPWSMRGVEGVYRFLGRVWRLAIDDRAEALKLSEAVKNVEPDQETLRNLHRTIQKVTEDLDAMRFNTAIAAMMEFSKNHLARLTVRPRSTVETFVLLLAPFAPHMAEELWFAFGHKDSLAYHPWPAFDEALTRAQQVEVPIQINGKLRSRVQVDADTDEQGLKTAALADEKIQSLLKDKTIRKVIVVPGKLVNVVTN